MEAVRVGAPRDAAADCCGLVNAAQRATRSTAWCGAVAPARSRAAAAGPCPGRATSTRRRCSRLRAGQRDRPGGGLRPVLPVLAFGTLTEAFALANDSKFGLTSSIYSSSVDVVERARAELRFGETYVNRELCAIQGFHAGMRQSGVGGADGKRGLDEYLATPPHVRRNPKAGD
ncbi:succinate-semialdehyde dehydrogenase [Aureococcus anophagefferens]|nr:succinate-semialdehyde dehydrogenase [Aureococcus anophagefferens]